MADRQATDRLQIWSRRSLIVGVVALVIGAIAAIFDLKAASEAYALAFIFWVGVSLGSMLLLLLSHATTGRWGRAIREVLESGAETIGLMAILFIPLLFVVGFVYSWADEDLALPPERRAYLNVPFFIGRSLLYLIVWMIIAYLFTWRRHRRRTPIDQQMPGAAAVGLIILFFTGTFAAIDWVMSLDPYWYSTGFGVYLLAGYVLSALSMTIVVTRRVHDRDRPIMPISKQIVHDLGNLLLVFVMFWSYMSFMQYLIIWSGNTAEDISWYLERTQGVWAVVALGLIALHFALPFFALLSRRLKRNIVSLAVVAAWVLALRFIETIWAVAPSFHREGIWIHWLDFVAPLGVGGLWFAMFSSRLGGRFRAAIEAGGTPRELA